MLMMKHNRDTLFSDNASEIRVPLYPLGCIIPDLPVSENQSVSKIKEVSENQAVSEICELMIGAYHIHSPYVF